MQDAHHFAATRDDWRVVTKREPTEAEWADAELAWRLVGWVKSNSIVLVKDGTAWGIGAGQQNRVEAGQIAASKAAGRAKGGACASDAFYPFPDGIEAAADAGVAVIIQPGGSVKDEDTIAKADELGLAMVFTGERHFLPLEPARRRSRQAVPAARAWRPRSSSSGRHAAEGRLAHLGHRAAAEAAAVGQRTGGQGHRRGSAAPARW